MAESKVFERVLDRTKQMVQDNERVKRLLVDVGEKLSRIGDGSSESQSLVKLIKMLIRMVRAHVSGTYRAFSSGTVVMSVFVLVYFLMPLDLIPDLLPVLGFTDDLSVSVFIMRRFQGDIERYRAWEKEQLAENE